MAEEDVLRRLDGRLLDQRIFSSGGLLGRRYDIPPTPRPDTPRPPK